MREKRQQERTKRGKEAKRARSREQSATANRSGTLPSIKRFKQGLQRTVLPSRYAQSQSIKLNKPLCILLIISPCIILKGRDAGIK